MKSILETNPTKCLHWCFMHPQKLKFTQTRCTDSFSVTKR
jgi:hypothetical protein